MVVEETIPSLNSTNVTLSTKCPYPSYYSYIGVLTLVATSMPTYICYLGKAYLMYATAGFQCFTNIWLLGSRLDWEDHASSPLQPSAVPSKFCLSVTLLTVATSLVIVSRYVSSDSKIYTFNSLETLNNKVERARDPVCIPRSSLISVSEKETWLSLSLSLSVVWKNSISSGRGRRKRLCRHSSRITISRETKPLSFRKGRRKRERGGKMNAHARVYLKKKTLRPNRSNNGKKKG